MLHDLNNIYSSKSFLFLFEIFINISLCQKNIMEQGTNIKREFINLPLPIMSYLLKQEYIS